MNAIQIFDSLAVRVLICIMKNPGIGPLKIAKKTKIPQATVYRSIMALNDADMLKSMKIKPGRNGGNSISLYESKKKQIKIIISKNGIRFV